MQKRLSYLFAAFACAALAACSTPGGPVPVQNSQITSHHLYVTDNNKTLQVFTLPLTASSVPAFSIANAGTGGMAVNSSTLAISAGDNVNLFSLPLTSASAAAFSIISPSSTDVKFDSAGNLWSSNQTSSTCCLEEFTAPLSASSTPAVTLNEPSGAGYPWGLTFDSAGNLYAAGARVNDVFAPPFSSSSTPTTFGANSDNYGIVAYGGHLFVANATSDGEIDVFATPVTSSSTPAFTLTPSTNYIGYPSFDASGDLYVPVPDDNKIYVYNAPVTAGSTPAFSVTVPTAYATATGQ